mmetsp:Transcript_58440/g.102742  ORF Transcript_58440/g.102742 Transcript_58440/m.102742 type:complete len:278 (+) Transcript_58440:4449-5282(+)
MALDAFTDTGERVETHVALTGATCEVRLHGTCELLGDRENMVAQQVVCNERAVVNFLHVPGVRAVVCRPLHVTHRGNVGLKTSVVSAEEKQFLRDRVGPQPLSIFRKVNLRHCCLVPVTLAHQLVLVVHGVQIDASIAAPNRQRLPFRRELNNSNGAAGVLGFVYNAQVFFVQHHKCSGFGGRRRARKAHHDDVAHGVKAHCACLPVKGGDLQLCVGGHVKHTQGLVLSDCDELGLARVRRHAVQLSKRMSHRDGATTQVRAVDGGNFEYIGTFCAQ